MRHAIGIVLVVLGILSLAPVSPTRQEAADESRKLGTAFLIGRLTPGFAMVVLGLALQTRRRKSDSSLDVPGVRETPEERAERFAGGARLGIVMGIATMFSGSQINGFGPEYALVGALVPSLAGLWSFGGVLIWDAPRVTRAGGDCWGSCSFSDC